VLLPPDAPVTHGQFWPLTLAKTLAVAGRHEYSLTFVGVYCGAADPRRDAKTAGARQRQVEAWRYNGATVFTRPLRYPKDWPDVPAVEKGVDVMLAIDFVTMAVARKYDVGILASCDTDLVPAVEAVLALTGPGAPAVELIAWANGSSKIGIPDRSLVYREIGAMDYRNIHDPTDYNVVGRPTRNAPPP
jgi:hypothetical protein